jgi:hypothetical protein
MRLFDLFLGASRWLNRSLGGPPDQSASQTVGFAQLRRVWWARPVALILELVNFERRHCLKALYKDSGWPIWPERMPPGAPPTLRDLRGWPSGRVDAVVWVLLAGLLLIIAARELIAAAGAGS